MLRVGTVLIWQTNNSADVSIFFLVLFTPILLRQCPQTHQMNPKKTLSIFHSKCIFISAVPPMVWIQNQLVGSAIGQRIVLECQSEAFPKSINYWMKNDTIITLGESIAWWI